MSAPSGLRECPPVTAQSPVDIHAVRYLAFSGGGIRGLAYVGVLQALLDSKGIDFGAGVPNRLLGVAGCSVGALFALMLAMGMSVQEITAMGNHIDTGTLAKPSISPMIRGIWAFDDGRGIRSMVQSFLQRKLGVSDISLGDLRARTGVDLVVTATDLTACGVRYLRAETDAQMSVVDAVTASMALPPVFAPVTDAQGHVLVDGGIMENSPLLLFPPEHLLAFLFTFNVEENFQGITSYIRRVMSCISIGSEQAAWLVTTPAVRSRVVVIDTPGILAVDAEGSLHVDQDKRRSLVASGYRACTDALARWARGDDVAPAATRVYDGDVAHCLPADVLASRQLPLYVTAMREKLGQWELRGDDAHASVMHAHAAAEQAAAPSPARPIN